MIRHLTVTRNAESQRNPMKIPNLIDQTTCERIIIKKERSLVIVEMS